MKDGNFLRFPVGNSNEKGEVFISFYVGVEAIEKFALDLIGFATKKNAIYFPYDKALPVNLFESIAKWCLG